MSREPKGYVIARVTVSDPEVYVAYAKAAGDAQKKYGAKVLVRGGAHVALEGDARPRNVVLEFESLAQAQAYYHSAEYQAAKMKREGVATAEIVAVQGVEG
jgi:uncharacterized protein (DUF1330 family)